MAEPANPTLEARLRVMTAEGSLRESLPDGAVRCVACGHRCKILPGRAGICDVRFNEGGQLRVPWGYVAGLQLDPIEKKPFFHAFPGARALSFGMLGCDFRCAYCQNWSTSQALRELGVHAGAEPVTAARIVDQAVRGGAKVITSTYNEPLITAEWAVEVFREAKARGLVASFVSNGNATAEVLDFLRPWVDLYKVDLKSFNPKNYTRLGGSLQKVLDSLVMLKARQFWVEVVTLVVPGFNDSDDELRDTARFLAALDPGIPWHVTAFHRDYRMTEPDDTDTGTLLRAARIGREAGLDFVYAGNLPGCVGELENTRCPTCSRTLIERHGFRVLHNDLVQGACPGCGTLIPGVWG